MNSTFLKKEEVVEEESQACGRRRRVLLLDASVQKSGAASMDTLGIPTHTCLKMFFENENVL